MTVLLPFVINAGMNFVLGLLVALFLGPDEFGRYAIGAAIIVLVNTALMDWLKLSAVRFYSQGTRQSQPEIRATLDLLAAGISLSLCALLVAAVAAGLDLRLPAMLVSAAVLAGITAGLFDYHGAIARARYLDAAYARMMLVKNLLGLVLMVGGAWWLRDATMVLLGGLASTAASLLAVRRALADAPLALRGFRKDLAWSFACYALPLVAGNAIYSLIPLINRSLLAGAHGFAEAGYFSLASDIGLRLFGTLGAGIEIVLLREILRLEETKGRAAARRRIARNLPLVLLIALPAAVGLLCILPAFERLMVPPSFRGSFGAYMTLLLPGFLAIALFQAALYPVFLVEKRTLVAPLAALLALAVNLLLGAWLAGSAGPLGYGLAQSAAFLTVLAVTGFVALRNLPAPPLRDSGLVILAALLMAVAIWPLRDRFAALPELALQLGLGAVVYGAVLLAADALHGRTVLRLWWLARRSRRPAP